MCRFEFDATDPEEAVYSLAVLVEAGSEPDRIVGHKSAPKLSAQYGRVHLLLMRKNARACSDDAKSMCCLCIDASERRSDDPGVKTRECVALRVKLARPDHARARRGRASDGHAAS